MSIVERTDREEYGQQNGGQNGEQKERKQIERRPDSGRGKQKKR